MLVHLFLITGARRGEILGLKWSMVDFMNLTIKITSCVLYSSDWGIYETTPKTKKSKRTISLPPETMKLLMLYKKWQIMEYKDDPNYDDNDFLFTQDNGKPMHPDSVNDYLNKFSKKYDLPHINSHAFRHTMASMLYYSGVDTISISNRLGHAQPSTTSNIYAHVIDKSDKQNAEVLSKIYNL